MSSTEHAAPKTEEAKPGFKPIDEEVFETKTGSDLGKVALFVALLAVILMVMLYFSQQQNISGLAGKMDEMQGVKQEMVAVKDHVAVLEEEIATLRDLPKEARKIIVSSLLSESASKINYLISQMESEEQQAKLADIRKMLQELATDL
ncbi:MAG TPA: hypothetical protein ENN39_10095 [Desulfonatronum sp.]|nr:hypothetical protein [Desulfonatronum sp.]